MSEKLKHKFQIHYYLKDDSHSMDAETRNRAEKDFLDAVSRIAELSGTPLTIETVAYEEGGLKEIYVFLGITITFLSPSINNVITYYFTQDKEIAELDKKIKEETLKGLQLDNAVKESELLKALSDKKVIRSVSAFYKKVEKYEKVHQIGFMGVSSDSKEHVIERKDFGKFILHDSKELIEDDDAEIEIISPVLNRERFKWRGLYKDEQIDFSMGDGSFKQEVESGQHSFLHGSTIVCHLNITITYDDFGDEVKKSYSVSEVHSITHYKKEEPVLRQSGLRKERVNNQIKLFSEPDKGEQEE